MTQGDHQSFTMLLKEPGDNIYLTSNEQIFLITRV